MKNGDGNDMSLANWILLILTAATFASSLSFNHVIFAEIPPDFTPTDTGSELLKVVAHVSVPIFVKPSGVAATLKVEGLSATRDHLRFAVRNTGAAHALVERIHVDAVGDAGRIIGTGEVAGWYVLPSLARPFDVDIAASKLPCAGAKQLVVTAISRESGQSSATIDQPACAAR